MSVTLTMNMKQSFFDRQAVIRAVDKAERRAMSRSLSYIRQTARRDVLRRRKSSSKPGQAPSVHSRDPKVSLRNILFAYDAARSGGVVGPVGLNSRNRNGGQPIPSVMEFGGQIRQRKGDLVLVSAGERDRKGRFLKNKFRKLERSRVIRVQPRPFMQVAFDREMAKGNIISPWHNAVVGA